MTAHHRHAPADPTRINLEHDDEVRYWCIEFRITPDALRSAVDKVGPSPTTCAPSWACSPSGVGRTAPAVWTDRTGSILMAASRPQREAT
jgi:hypothetical protein